MQSVLSANLATYSPKPEYLQFADKSGFSFPTNRITDQFTKI